MGKVIQIILILALLALPLSACSQPAPVAPGDTLEGTITVSGAFALYPMMTRWAEEFRKAHPRVQFDISGGRARGKA